MDDNDYELDYDPCWDQKDREYDTDTSVDDLDLPAARRGDSHPHSLGANPMIVRFTTTCDFKAHAGDEPCGRRAGEYTSWPTCRECMGDICPDHTAPGTDDGGDESGHYVTCLVCAEEAPAE